MQALDQKKHHNMAKAIGRYEEYATLCGHIIPEDKDEIIRESIAEFKGTYDYYHLLIKELERCIEDYKDLHGLLQRMVYPYARKMNGELQKRKHF